MSVDLSSNVTDRPGVIALPPLIYLVAMTLGIALHFLRPLTLPVPVAVRWVGLAMIVAEFAVLIPSRLRFVRAGTNVNPMKPATALVTTGIYRFTRNPMYVGLMIGFTGLALLTRIGWLLVELPVVLAIMHWGVILREERYLSRKFGAEYEAYRARVRRYF
jgi:protein-S-isoprenylcysteine O-methyltransferase Ste14